MSEDFNGVKGLEYAGANILEALVKIILNGEEVRLTGTMEDGQVLMRILDGTTHYWTNRTPGYPEGVDISGKVDKVTGKGLSTIDFTQTLLDLLNSKVGAENGKSLVSDTQIAKIHDKFAENEPEAIQSITDSINALQEAVAKVPYRIILPAASTVAGRCVTPTELPTDWTVSEGTSDQDLLITHTLSTRKPVAVFIWANMPGGEREMQGSLAKVGLIAPSSTTLVIESLCTKEYPIRIEILFN